MANKHLSLVNRKVAKALHQFALLQPGDRVLLGVSGGKDSTLLLRELSLARRHSQWDFSLQAVYVHSEFAPDSTRLFVEQICREWEVPLHIIEVNMQQRLKPQRTMNCYWCSTQRRTELINYALAHDFNTLALGHHLDDILETITMNWTQKGQLSGMAPRVNYQKYPLKLIRPLVYVEEREISKYIATLALDKFTCVCDFNSNSQRKKVRTWLDQLTDNSYTIKSNMLQAVIQTAWQELVEERIVLPNTMPTSLNESAKSILTKFGEVRC